ncbi:MAG: hypothetical protein K8S87_02170 [Planctomycetes bacterium]|nr:hypothetical protein [Planctomycetota bacterium]
MNAKKPNKHKHNPRSRVADITSPVSLEVKKKKKKSLTLKDYGKQKGYMWGTILFIYSIILILSKVMYEVQYDEGFPTKFNELFILFLPLAVGLAAFLIARISAVAVRGILLVLAVAAPWIYTINMGLPPFDEFFKYTLHVLHGENFIPFYVALAFAFVGNFVYNSLRAYFPERKGARFWSFLPIMTFMGFVGLIALFDKNVYSINVYFHFKAIIGNFPLNLFVIIPAFIAFLYFLDGIFVSKRGSFHKLLFWLTSLFIVGLIAYWTYESTKIVPTYFPQELKKFSSLTGRILFDSITMFMYLFALVGLLASGFADICINLLLTFTKKKKKPKAH